MIGAEIGGERTESRVSVKGAEAAKYGGAGAECGARVSGGYKKQV